MVEDVDHLDGIHTKDSCHPLLANSTAIITYREWREFPRRPGSRLDEMGMGDGGWRRIQRQVIQPFLQAERLPRFTYRRNENNLVKRLKRFLKLHLQLSSVNTASHCEILVDLIQSGLQRCLKIYIASIYIEQWLLYPIDLHTTDISNVRWMNDLVIILFCIKCLCRCKSISVMSLYGIKAVIELAKPRKTRRGRISFCLQLVLLTSRIDYESGSSVTELTKSVYIPFPSFCS